MNKRAFIIVLSGFLSLSVFSQMSFNSLYSNFSREENVEKVNLGGLLMLMAKPFVNKHTQGASISSIKVLSLEDCTPEVKARFNNQARLFRDKRYELFVNSNEKDDKTRIYLRFDKNMVREMVIISMGDEPALISLKGKIRPEDIEKWTENTDDE
ncbi:MAG: DUF4252 domain-containing protein [Petrimonas sp.]|nr:DUF4252 domain-containing protein [Petrimonas sp.]